MFTYDAGGARAAKHVNARPLGMMSHYYISEAYELRQTEAGDTTVEKYIFAGNQRIAKITTHDASDYPYGGELSYIHKDHLGSTTVVTDENGDLIPGQPELTQYRPYGQPRAGYALNTKTAYNFTDQEWDDSTGLYNYDARLYNPEIGMFITADSLIQDNYDPQYLNRYAYCRNNPIKYMDPDGHESVGEMIDKWATDAATSGNVTEHKVASVVGAIWDLVGAEAVSQVADSLTGGDDASAADYAFAALEVVTVGKGDKLAKGLKNVGGKVLGAVAKHGDEVANVAKHTDEIAEVAEGAGKALKKTEKQIERGAEKGQRAMKRGSGSSHQQYQEISDAQSKVRKGKSDQIIDSTEKSKQRADHDLKRISSLEDALDEWDQ